MKFLQGEEEQVALGFIKQAAEVAKNATCTRSACGSVIVKDGGVIGKGYNSPPHDLESQRRCTNKKTDYDFKVTDKTCCVHAEQRAIMDALKTNPDKLPGSRLYFIRLKDSGEMHEGAGKPYCTICSKMSLDVGITEFVLLQVKGVAVYNTEEYNDESYAFTSEN